MNKEHWAAALAAVLVGGQEPNRIHYREIRGEGKPIRRGPHVGRNDPCPCGSGKKFKTCHLADPAAVYAVAASVVTGATRQRAFLNTLGATTHRTICDGTPDEYEGDRGCPPS